MELDRAALEQQKAEIKLALKTWEARFIDQNGRKAGREDIKADAAIALKYKEYQRTQDLLSGKLTASKPSPTGQKRDRREFDMPESPSKRRKTPPQTTPQKKRTTSTYLPTTRQAEQTVPQPEQEQEQQFLTPAIKRTFMGPTPQKDGIVLGIFDSPPVAGTPNRRPALAERDVNVAVTPSARHTEKIQESPEAQYEERARGSRTPASTGKRYMLDAFLTPSHKRAHLDEDAENRAQATPSSVLKTPAFLRRDNFVMSTVDEEPASPQMAQPWKRRSFGRSLSGMIRDMRREQAQREDEELDLLNELEDEAAGISAPKLTATKTSQPPKIVVQDSQTGLDRDGFVPSDLEHEVSEVEETEVQLGRDGKPRKPWKKKGLKRQTRRVNMRPVAKKVQAQVEEVAEEDEEVVLQDTQVRVDVPSDLEDLEDGSDGEYSEDSRAKKQKLKTAAKASSTAKDKGNSKEKASTEKKAPAKRKVKADAHANYRALKIKNKNSKGKGGRYGRRR